MTQTWTTLKEMSGGLLGSANWKTWNPLHCWWRGSRSKPMVGHLSHQVNGQPLPQSSPSLVTTPLPLLLSYTNYHKLANPAFVVLDNSPLPKRQTKPRAAAWVCSPGHSLPDQHHSQTHTHPFSPFHVLYMLFTWNILLRFLLCFFNRIFLFYWPAKVPLPLVYPHTLSWATCICSPVVYASVWANHHPFSVIIYIMVCQTIL